MNSVGVCHRRRIRLDQHRSVAQIPPEMEQVAGDRRGEDCHQRPLLVGRRQITMSHRARRVWVNHASTPPTPASARPYGLGSGGAARYEAACAEPWPATDTLVRLAQQLGTVVLIPSL